MNPARLKNAIDTPPAWLKEGLKRSAVWYCERFRSGRSFTLGGREYGYFYHTYNLAWRNERSVEVPLALERLRRHQGGAVLEVGNVLRHYVPIEHEVIDKYERGAGVFNVDAAEFRPGRLYQLILSVSTLEHVGIPPDEPGGGKVLAVVENLVSLLAPGGELWLTASLGLNTEFDALVERRDTPFDEVRAMRRTVGKNEWREVGLEAVRDCGYPESKFRADAIVICTTRKGTH